MLRSEPHIPDTFSSINLMDGRRDRDRMVFGFSTTYVISAYQNIKINVLAFTGLFDWHGFFAASFVLFGILYLPSFDVMNVGLFVVGFRKLWKYFFWSSAVLVRNKSSFMQWRLKIP